MAARRCSARLLLALGPRADRLDGRAVRRRRAAARSRPGTRRTRLVVRGPYRRVRNPMISGVLGVLLGEAALFGSLAVLAWSAFVFALNAVYFLLVEEPGLRERFGADYEAYCARPALDAAPAPVELPERDDLGIARFQSPPVRRRIASNETGGHDGDGNRARAPRAGPGPDDHAGRLRLRRRAPRLQRDDRPAPERRSCAAAGTDDVVAAVNYARENGLADRGPRRLAQRARASAPATTRW